MFATTTSERVNHYLQCTEVRNVASSGSPFFQRDDQIPIFVFSGQSLRRCPVSLNLAFPSYPGAAAARVRSLID